MSVTKTCSSCNQQKVLADFNKKSSNKDGLERYCKVCHRVYNKAHYTNNVVTYKASANKWRNIKRLWWNKHKKLFRCVVCGESRPHCIDFHHIDPANKDTEVSRMISNNRSIRHILDEIAKCVAVCKNCHAEIHYRLDNGINLTDEMVGLSTRHES